MLIFAQTMRFRFLIRTYLRLLNITSSALASGSLEIHSALFILELLEIVSKIGFQVFQKITCQNAVTFII